MGWDTYKLRKVLQHGPLTLIMCLYKAQGCIWGVDSNYLAQWNVCSCSIACDVVLDPLLDSNDVHQGGKTLVILCHQIMFHFSSSCCTYKNVIILE